MKKLNTTEFFAALEKGGNILYTYDSERFAEFLSEPSECEIFTLNDILMVKMFDGENYDAYAWLTHDVRCEEVFAEFLADEKCTTLMASAIGFLPHDIDKYGGGLAFERTAERYTDDGIIPLCEKHAHAILTACDTLTDSGDCFAQEEAESFRYITENNLYTAFGVYDNDVLAGMVYYRINKAKKMGVLSELAVLPNYQRRGLGRRLVKRALNEGVGYNFICTCSNRNAKSARLAENCGFSFCGVKNLRLKLPQEED